MVEDVGNIVGDKTIRTPLYTSPDGRRHQPFHTTSTTSGFRSALRTVPAVHLSFRVFLRAYNTPNDGSMTYRDHMDFVQ